MGLIGEACQVDRVAKLRFPEPSPCGKTPLTADGLSKSFGSLEIFTDVDLATANDLTIQCTVNGEQRQLGRTGEMIHPIEDLIVKLREDVAVVIVTHNLQQAYRVADYVAFMYLGDLVEYGSATNVFGAPNEDRTKEYVGGAFG